jgi:hypothetical protein
MRNIRLLTVGTLGAVLAGALPAAAAGNSSAALPALQTIQRDATAIAAGRYPSKAELQAPAREIALAWSQAANILGADGNVRVELKVANDSVTELERNWQQSDKARSDAKSVASSVSDLIDATKHSGSSS